MMYRRLQEIAARVQSKGMVQARNLASEFGVFMETIRKDLAQLEKEGIVHWEYGQAVAASAEIEKNLSLRPNRDIFTNSLEIARMMDGNVHCLFLLPGRKRAKNQSLVRPWTEEYLSRIHVEVCVLHADGPTCHSYSEISTKRKMMECSDFVIVALDADKFQESGPHTYASWDEVDAIITDRRLDGKIHSMLLEKLEVWMAQDESAP